MPAVEMACVMVAPSRSDAPRRAVPRAEKPAWAQGENDRKQCVDSHVPAVDGHRRRPKGLRHAQAEATQKGPRHGPDATQNGGDQRLQSDRKTRAVADASE